jgi:hypothetical protein
MAKRFLNVQYGGNMTRINVTDMEDLSEVINAIALFYKESISSPERIKLYDKDNALVEDLDDIPEDYYKKLKAGGLSLTIQLLPVEQSIL